MAGIELGLALMFLLLLSIELTLVTMGTVALNRPWSRLVTRLHEGKTLYEGMRLTILPTLQPKSS
jgi:hypothetical protein